MEDQRWTIALEQAEHGRFPADRYKLARLHAAAAMQQRHVSRELNGSGSESSSLEEVLWYL